MGSCESNLSFLGRPASEALWLVKYAFIAGFFIAGGSIPFLAGKCRYSRLFRPKQPFKQTSQGAAFGT